MLRRALHKLAAAAAAARGAPARGSGAARRPLATWRLPSGAGARGGASAAAAARAPSMPPSLLRAGWSGGRRGIFIQTQTTPNPASLMFMPGKPVNPDAPPLNFATPREAMASPLAKKLFAIDGVVSVFFGADYVTVTKNETHEWGVLKPEVFAAVMDHYASGDPLVSGAFYTNVFHPSPGFNV
jgi:NFU1 iron-sulfur cluster scaffold homolog, mitochondrial